MKEFTIAIIDEESEQRELFEFVFSTNFNVIQIGSLESIEELINQIRSERIDAIAIDYRLTEHGGSFENNGDFIFKEVRKNLYEYPVFILTRSSDDVKKVCKTIDPSFIIDKEKISYGKGEQNKQAMFLEEINTKILVYKNDLQDKMNKLNELEELRRTSPDEFKKNEIEYINLNFELGKYIMGTPPIPVTYFTDESNKRLDDLLTRTEKLLTKLNQK